MSSSAMLPHQQRVVEEFDQLDERLEKLEAFIKASPVFATLTPDERARLQWQRYYMGGYRQILCERIGAFR